MLLTAALVTRTDRPIDLIDLNSVSLPLLAHIVRNGRRLLAGAAAGPTDRPAPGGAGRLHAFG